MCISLLSYIKNMWNHFVEKVFYINTHMYSCTAVHMRMSLPRYITNKWHHFVSFCGEGVLYEHTHVKLYSYAYVHVSTYIHYKHVASFCGEVVLYRYTHVWLYSYALVTAMHVCMSLPRYIHTCSFVFVEKVFCMIWVLATSYSLLCSI